MPSAPVDLRRLRTGLPVRRFAVRPRIQSQSDRYQYLWINFRVQNLPFANTIFSLLTFRQNKEEICFDRYIRIRYVWTSCKCRFQLNTNLDRRSHNVFYWIAAFLTILSLADSYRLTLCIIARSEARPSACRTIPFAWKSSDLTIKMDSWDLVSRFDR